MVVIRGSEFVAETASISEASSYTLFIESALAIVIIENADKSTTPGIIIFINMSTVIELQ